jgi:hypothetical protein
MRCHCGGCSVCCLLLPASLLLLLFTECEAQDKESRCCVGCLIVYLRSLLRLSCPPRCPDGFSRLFLSKQTRKPSVNKPTKLLKVK